MQNSTDYATSQQAEEAFYQAFEQGNIEMMMSVWSKDEDIACIHPGGPRLDGRDAIRESWQQIFTHDRGIEFAVNQQQVSVEKDIAIHYVIESISVHGELRSEIIATNLYRKTDNGWRMILHHASPGLRLAVNQPHSESEVQTLH